MTSRDLNRWQARWSLVLNRFNFVIQHRPGRLSSGPDELSRRADHEIPIGAADNAGMHILPPQRVVLSDSPLASTCGRQGIILGDGRHAASDVVAQVGEAILSEHAILEKVRVAARVDPALAALWSLDKAPGTVRKGLRDFVIDGGLVQFRGLIYVPNDEEIKHLLLRLHHDAIPAGHPGISNTAALLSRNYYWPCMREYVTRYVEGCGSCQQRKSRRQKPFGPLQPLEIPDGPWQHISTDYIGPLPPSRGFDAMQVVTDKLTKRVHFLGTHTTDGAVEMCDMFLERVWRLHGTPKKITADRGPQFAARDTARMWERIGIKRSLSTAHHHAYVDFYQDDWMDWLPFAEFAYNNREHSAIGMSPFVTEYGYNPSFSVDPVNSQSVPKADERLGHIRHTQEELHSLLELASDRMKRYHDRGVVETPTYGVGDKVYLERADLRSTRPSAMSWTIHNVFHVSCLVPQKEDTIPGCRQPPPPPVEMEDGPEVEIERILKERRARGGVSEFLVRWKGYDESEDEWLKEYDMTHARDAIAEFRENERTRGKSRRHRR